MSGGEKNFLVLNVAGRARAPIFPPSSKEFLTKAVKAEAERTNEEVKARFEKRPAATLQLMFHVIYCSERADRSLNNLHLPCGDKESYVSVFFPSSLLIHLLSAKEPIYRATVLVQASTYH